MSLSRAIAGNTAVQVGGKLISTLLGIATVAVMTRYLGDAGYGAFTTVISFLQFFGILADFGLTLTMIRMVSDGRHDESRVVSNIFTLRLVTAVAFFGVAPAIAMFFPYSAQIKLGILLATLSFLNITLSQVLLGVFQKHLAIHRASAAEIAGRVVLLVGVALAAWRHWGFMAVILALVLANFSTFLIALAAARKFVRIRLAADMALWREIIRDSWPIGVSIAFNLVYLKGDVVIMSVFRSQAEVGLYGAAYKILDVVTVIPTVFMGLVLPALSASWAAGDRATFNRRLSRAFDFMAVLALPLAVGALAVGRDLMRLVAGAQFAASGTYLGILMLAGAAVFWSALFGHAVVALGLQRRTIRAYALDAIVSLVLYLVFIPRYGAVAAAWVTVFSEAFIALLVALVVGRATKAFPSFSVFFRALAASGMMYVGLLALGDTEVLLLMLAGMAIYGVFIVAFGGVTRETLAMFKKSSGPAIEGPSP